jgi:hypothetical protein
MGRRTVHLAAGTIGLSCLVVGVFGAYRLLHLISLELQGECDYMPCADAGTYGWSAFFILLAILGATALSMALIQVRQRSRAPKKG